MCLVTLHHWWVSVISGLLSAEFICHTRRPYTTAPEGRLDTLLWLSLPPSISGYALSPYLQPSSSLFLSTFPLSLLPSRPPSHPLHLSLPFSLLLFARVRSTEPGLWTGNSSGEGRSTRISHARHRWASLSVQEDSWRRLWHTNAWCISISPFRCTWQLSWWNNVR